MKRFYKLICAVLAAMCVFCVATVLAACSDPEETPPPPAEYTITLMLNEEQEWDSFTGKAGDAVEFEKGMPTRSNSVLKGWSTTPNGEAKPLPAVMPESDQTYYAVFVRYYNLTLRAGAGALAGEDNIRAEEGQNLYALIKDIAPTAPGSSKFDGWYYGNKKIDAGSTDVMPANTITLDAKYTVDYTINIFKQNNYKSDEYTKVVADTVSNSGFIGSSPRDSEYPSYVGFEFDEQKSGATSDFVLSATSDNVFSAYYNIQAYRLVFNPNTPAEGLSVGGSMGTAEWGYNVENTIPDCGYSITGYRFSHWSTTADGKDRIDVCDKYSITDSITLYAVWTRGYADITGRSYDYIYVVENKDGSTVAYLDRYYLDELAGTYDKTTNTVSFKENGKEILRGKLDPNGYTFAYINTQAYVLHALGDMSDDNLAGYLDETVTLTLGYNGIAVYSENGNSITGTYAMDSEQQSMKFTAIDGDDTFYFRLSGYLTDGGNVDVFEIRSEAEVGEWCKLTDNYANGSDYADENFVLELNGYGEAVMHTQSRITESTRDYTGYYRYAAGATKNRLEIYTIFITSYDSDISRVMLVDRTTTADDSAQYKKFYKAWEFATTAYAKPADGEELDIETADSIALDGYGLYDDSAVFTSGDGEQTANGKYTLNWTNRTLVFGNTTYFVDIHTVGDGDEAKAYLVYEPMQTGKDEFNKLYAISGLENSFRPGVAYGFRFFNDNEAVLYVWMPDVNSVFNTLNATLQPVIEGTYTELAKGEYLFQADIAPEAVALIKYYYTNIFSFQVGLDISGFGDFKFKFTSSAAGEVTALGDGYAGISVVDNGATYVTDGYGMAKVTNEQGIVTDTREYALLNTMGLPCLYLLWTETELDVNNKPVEVSKQKMYTLINGEYRAYVDEYGKHNTQYSSQIPDTTFRMVVYEGDYAVLAYENSTTRQLVMYSWGKVNWADSEKKFGIYEEYGVVNSSGDILMQLYGDFKFGLKEITLTVSGKETTVTRLFTYDAPTSGVVNGKYVITGSDGATLAVDINKGEAEYSVTKDGSKTTISGEFKLRENILSIVYTVEGEDEKTYVRSNAFKLIYENNEITSFIPVGSEAGTWIDATGVNGSILLSGEAADAQGEYKGTWYGYDRDTDSIKAIDGTYARTDNEETVEYVFKFTTEPDAGAEGDDGKRSFNFALGYDSARMPIYRIYSLPAYIVLYGSVSSTMPSYMIRGGGYTDLVLIDTYNNQTVGQLLIYPNANLLLKDTVLYAFGTNEIEPKPLLFFTIIGEGENMRGIILDGTFAAVNFGRFDCEDSRELTVSVLKDSESGEYEDQKITPTGIFFNGMGIAMLIDSKNDRALSVMYLRYNTNTYALVTADGDSINIVALLRLYTSTVNVTDDNGEETTETKYIVRFDDVALRQTFKGAGHTAFITDGFGSATYADERGELHVCTYKRLENNPEVVEVKYLDGMQLAYMYIEVDAENGTFEALSADD